MIAEHGINSGSQEIDDRPLVLGVPPPRDATESVEECRETTVPVTVVQVDPVDSEFAEVRGPPLWSLAEVAEAGGVDEVHVGIDPTPVGELAMIWMAEPQPVDGSGFSRRPESRPQCLGILDVERQGKTGPADLVELGQAGHMGGQLVSTNLVDRSATDPASDDSTVVEHCHAVRGDPDIALESGRAESGGQAEGFQGVFGSMRARAPMSEQDGGSRQWT